MLLPRHGPLRKNQANLLMRIPSDTLSSKTTKDKSVDKPVKMFG
jgi:hypothetical protein